MLIFELIRNITNIFDFHWGNISIVNLNSIFIVRDVCAQVREKLGHFFRTLNSYQGTICNEGSSVKFLSDIESGVDI